MAFRLAPLLLLAALLGWAATPGPASANRFGPPWQVEVTVEETVVHTAPDPSSPIVGPLSRSSIVPMLAQVQGTDGRTWQQLPMGYAPAGDLAERNDPWIAEVSVPSVSVYARPNAGSEIRRTAGQGDLQRVTGLSPGLNGDTSVWYATTEGYVGLGQLTQAHSEWAASWSLPDPNLAAQGWWGRIQSAANVRAGPTTEAPIVGSFEGGELVKVLQEEQGRPVNGNPSWYLIDGGRYAGARIHSSLVAEAAEPTPDTTPPAGQSGTWIVVSREHRTLTLVRDGRAEFTTYVAIGDAGQETDAGVYATFGKYRADDMTSTSIPDPTDYYDLPNVPATQYFREGGYALHGTYWHDQFGGRQSHGCINLTWTDGAFLFAQTSPELPADRPQLWVEPAQATPVVIR